MECSCLCRDSDMSFIFYSTLLYMDNKRKVVVCATAAYMLLSKMATIIQCRKRKRDARRVGITYGPLEERDRIRLEYLDNKI